MISYATLIHKMDINEYHKHEGISSSGISLILECPKRYWHEYLNPSKKDEKITTNDKFKLGTAVHMLVLEPTEFDKHFVVLQDGFDARTKKGKEHLKCIKFDLGGDFEVLPHDEYIEASAMANSILSNPIWESFGDRNIEHSIFWNAGIYSTPLKSRPDVYNNELIIDIKTTSDLKTFGRSARLYGYHRQAAMQIDALSRLDGIIRQHILLAVEKKEPYLCKTFELSTNLINTGTKEYLNAAMIYSECMRLNEWPGYDHEVIDV